MSMEIKQEPKESIKDASNEVEKDLEAIKAAEGPEDVGNDSGDGRRPGGAKRRIIDETLLDDDEARRLEARRAYNRQCAAKARKRSKDLIAHLQQQVEELSKDKAQLERTNEVMQAQLQLLEQQNRTLMMNQRTSSVAIPSMGAVGGPGSLLGGFHQGNTGTAAQIGQNTGAAGFPSVSLLESLSAQGRFASFQNDGQQGGLLPQMAPRPTAAPSAPGGGIDANKYYLG